MDAIMNNKIPKCEKCGRELKQSGPYSDNIDGPVRKGPIEIHFWCNYEDCEKYNKSFTLTE